MFEVVATCVLFGTFGGLLYLLLVHLDGTGRFHHCAADVLELGLDVFHLASDSLVLLVACAKSVAHVGKLVLQAVVGDHKCVDGGTSVVKLALRVLQVLQTGFQRAELGAQCFGVAFEFGKLRLGADGFLLHVQQILGCVVGGKRLDVVEHRLATVLLQNFVVACNDVFPLATQSLYFGRVDVDVAVDFLNRTLKLVGAFQQQLAVEVARLDFRLHCRNFLIVEVGIDGKYARCVIGKHLLAV